MSARVNLLWVSPPHEDGDPVILPHRQDAAAATYAEVMSRAEKQGWHMRETLLYRKNGDRYEMPTLRFASNRDVTWMEWRDKPMALDPIYWEVIGIDASRWRMSARAIKTVALRVPILETLSWADQGLTPSENAARVFEALEQLSGRATGSYSSRIAAHPDRAHHLPLEVVALMHEGRTSEALTLLDQVSSGTQRQGHRLVMSRPGRDADSLELLRARIVGHARGRAAGEGVT